MKKNTLLVMLLSCCYCASVLTGCATRGSTPVPSVDLAAEKARVNEVLNQFFELARKRDWDATGELMSEDFEVYTDGAVVLGKKDYVELMKKDDLEVKDMELKDRTVQVSGDGRMAWMTYRGYFNCVTHGKPHVVETAETLIFRKDDEQRWKIVRSHASVKAVEPPAEKPRK